MRGRELLRLTAVAIVATGIAVSGAVAGELTPRLADELALRAPGELVPVIIIMQEAPDYASLEAEVASLSKEMRRSRVVDLLRESARETQAGISAELARLEAQGEVSDVRSFWVAPMISAAVTPEAARLIAARSDVAAVTSDAKVYMLDSSGPRAEVQPDATDAVVHDNQATPASRGIAWGVTWIGADQVWAMGYHGEGVLVAVLDTGIWYQHSDLIGRMHTNDDDPWPPNGVDDDGNGYIDDYYGYDFAYDDYDPTDGHGHGTHVSGTVAGDGTGGTQTGVAPAARLMACKVLDNGGYGQPSDVDEAIQYVIAEGGDVMSLSIGWYDADTWIRQLYRDATESARLAGVTMCIAAGNERGYSYPPNLVRSPGDCPPPWINPDEPGTGGLGGSITIGATGYYNDNYAWFSSNGPVHWQSISPWYDWTYPPGLIKPDVAAPGENVNSTTRGGGYSGDTWSGTSMATPHVSGMVALMLSKDPSLLPGQIDQILEETALDRGPAGKDNDYGAGRIQAPEAMDAINPDAIPPATVTDLATAAAPGFGRVRLNWTAPGDDGMTGTASEYDIRYQGAALGPIDTPAEWESAHQVINEPAPQPAGSSETMIVGTLQIGQSYYFALKSCDEVPNWSALSNSPVGTASGTPPGIGKDVVIIDSEDSETAVASLSVGQNQPNPVVGGTVIGFSLTAPSPVSLRIYDVTGKLVRVLADEEFAQGEHRVAWDARNESGARVPNGIYFYRLVTPTETIGRKLTVLH